MSEKFRVLDGEVDLEREDVRDSHNRRIDADYVERAVADVHARRGRGLQHRDALGSWCFREILRSAITEQSADLVLSLSVAAVFVQEPCLTPAS